MINTTVKFLTLTTEVKAIRNYDDEKTVANIIAGTVNNHDQSASVFNNAIIHPVEKWSEALEENKKLSEENKQLYERLLQAKKDKVSMLVSILEKK